MLEVSLVRFICVVLSSIDLFSASVTKWSHLPGMVIFGLVGGSRGDCNSRNIHLIGFNEQVQPVCGAGLYSMNLFVWNLERNLQEICTCNPGARAGSPKEKTRSNKAANPCMPESSWIGLLRMERGDVRVYEISAVKRVRNLCLRPVRFN